MSEKHVHDSGLDRRHEGRYPAMEKINQNEYTHNERSSTDLENLSIVSRLCVRLLEQMGQENIQEPLDFVQHYVQPKNMKKNEEISRRYMPNVKQTFMPQINWLLVQHFWRDHLECHQIPSLPKGPPLIARRWSKGVDLSCPWREWRKGRERERCVLEYVELST